MVSDHLEGHARQVKKVPTTHNHLVFPLIGSYHGVFIPGHSFMWHKQVSENRTCMDLKPFSVYVLFVYGRIQA